MKSPLLLPRRQLLSLGISSVAASLLASMLRPSRALALPARKTPIRQCIVLWMNGGPSHIDTFDPKPGKETGGPFKAIKTRAKGVEICEHLPHLAEQGHRLAVVRGMTSKEGNHQRARYLLHTGYSPNPTVTHPALGSWMSEELGDKAAELPGFVTIGGPSSGAGFLGVQHAPFFLRKAGALPENVSAPRAVDDARASRRQKALEDMEARYAADTGDPQVEGRRAVYAQAVRMMRSPRLEAFDLTKEPETLRAAYGDTDFGRGCLTARRLLENGVKLVEVTLDGWDTHKDNFERTKQLMGTLDPAFATLLRDLDERKLLASTLVVCMGDFGRTPKINDNDGRDHFPAAWSAVLAGGGVRGGVAHGETDATGAKVVRDPVTVPDLFATLATLLGMDPTKSFSTPSGRPSAITDAGTPVKALML